MRWRTGVTALGLAITLSMAATSAIPTQAAGGEVIAFTGYFDSFSPPMPVNGPGSGYFDFDTAGCEQAPPATACWAHTGENYSSVAYGTGSVTGGGYWSPRPGWSPWRILLFAGVGVVTGGTTGIVTLFPQYTINGPNGLMQAVQSFFVEGVVDP